MLKINQIVHNAWEMGLAIPAFNVPYLPMIAPVVRAIKDEDAFALVEVARLEWTKFGAQSPAAVAEEFFRLADLNYVRLHLDHIPVIDEDGEDVDYLAIVQEALKLGYHSVMVDGSRLELEENIRTTKEVVTLAHQHGAPCEAELGAVLGHEEGPLPPYDELFASKKGFTDVEEAQRFVAETACDWLSVAIGNVHGAISGALKDQKKTAARLDIDHLRTLRDATNVPLVLHGGSSIPREYVMAAIEAGIAKVNVGADIRQSYERVLNTRGDVQEAQESVYRRTRYLLHDYFDLTGVRSRVTGA